MLVVVRRQWYTQNSTCGELSIDGAFECYTLEPPFKHDYTKPRCIPAGTYVAKKQLSPHFNEATVWLQNVLDFEDIEIHPGNYPRDTHGCTVVGTTHTEDMVGNSRKAFNALMYKLPSDFEITYVDTIVEA